MRIVSQIATHLSVSGPDVLHALQKNVTGAYSLVTQHCPYQHESRDDTYLIPPCMKFPMSHKDRNLKRFIFPVHS